MQKKLHQTGERTPPPARRGHADDGSGGDGLCIRKRSPSPGATATVTRLRAARAPLWHRSRFARRVISHARTGTPLHSNPWPGRSPGAITSERATGYSWLRIPKGGAFSHTHTRGTAQLLRVNERQCNSYRNSYIRIARVWLIRRSSTLNGGYPRNTHPDSLTCWSYGVGRSAHWQAVTLQSGFASIRSPSAERLVDHSN